MSFLVVPVHLIALKCHTIFITVKILRLTELSSGKDEGPIVLNSRRGERVKGGDFYFMSAHVLVVHPNNFFFLETLFRGRVIHD